MPALSQFLRGFGIHHGLQINGYLLSDIQGEHKEIRRYREYEYPIQLTFVPQHYQVNPQNLLTQFTQIVSGTRTINSSYGNPYDCNMGNPQISQVLPNGTVVINTVGHSYRV